jgi:hypothetical protein
LGGYKNPGWVFISASEKNAIAIFSRVRILSKTEVFES